MNVPTITMPNVQALQKVAAYQRAVKRSKDPMLAAGEAGLAALAEGRTLLDLHMAVAAGGWTVEGHPRFAVARADRRIVRYYIENARLVFDARARNGGGRGHASLRRSIAMAAMPPNGEMWQWHRRHGEALVPMVPPDVREEALRKTLPRLGPPIRTWYILWEAVWKRIPPRDPILLQRVGGSLYSVLAQWDLTDLEQALMTGQLYGETE